MFVAVACGASDATGQSIQHDRCPVAVPSLGTGAPAAGTLQQDTTARAAAARDTGRVDVMLLASASAQQVRFNRQPEVRIRLCGGLDSVRVVERRNLPSPVAVGQTYRDVYVAVEILGRVDAECLVRRLGARSVPAVGVPPVVGDTNRVVDPGCASVTIGGASKVPREAAASVPAPAAGTEGAPSPPAPVRPRS